MANGTWTISTGTEGDDAFVVRIDERYRDTNARGNRRTRMSVRVMGPAMLQSAKNRELFEDRLEALLKPHDGVIVAGVARSGGYTFHAYAASEELALREFPIPEQLRGIVTVSIYDDPDWREYESWLPSHSFIARLRGWITFIGWKLGG